MVTRSALIAALALLCASVSHAQIPLRQSTASQAIKLGPFVDSTDGNTQETGLTVANTDVKLSKNGGTIASKNSGGCTHDANGWYTCTLDATDTNTVGRLTLFAHVSGALAVFREFEVLEESIYDGLYAANAGTSTTILPVNTTQLAGTAQTGRDIGASVLLSPGTGTGQVTITSGVIAADAVQISSDATAANNLETAFDDTAGAVPWVGITDQGTAQSATSTTLVLRGATPYGADNAPNGATLWAFGSTQGYWQSRAITGYVTSTDTATVEAWTVTPSGTITYKIVGTAPGASSGGLDAAGVRAAVGLATANLDTQLAAIDDYVDTEVATAVTQTTAANIRSAVGLASANIDTQLAAIESGVDIDTIEGTDATDAIDARIAAANILRPTTAGRTLDVTTTGEAGIDWANIGAPTTTVNLSGTTISTTQAVASVSGAVASVTGNVGGNVTGSVGSVATGGITAASIATDAIGGAEVAADVSTELLSGLANLAVNVAQVSGDTAAADALELQFDGTAGAVPGTGIIDRGTAQAATSTTLQLRTAASFTDDNIIGATCLITGGSAGVGQARAITDWVSSTDTATVETWTTTPTGTITYECYGTAPSSSGSGLDAAGVRAAIGLASANLDTQLTAIDDAVDTEVAAILVDTGTTLDDLVDDLETRLGTPSNLGGGATVAANLSDIEGQTDDIGTAGAGLTVLATAAALATVDDLVDTEVAGIQTYLTSNLGTLGANATAADDAVMTRLGAPAGASMSADIAAVKSDSGAILVDTNLLDDTLEDNAGTYRFTAAALAQAPTGSGESLTAIADAVWDELLSGHATGGSAGAALTTASGAAGLDAAGVRAALGLATANLDTQLTGIESGISWNAAWDTEVESEATDALAAYDPPTRAEATSDANSILTAVGDVPTNAELATSQAAADDATLAAIAALNNLAATGVRDLVIEDQGSGVTLGCAISVILAYAAGDLATTGANSTYEDPSGTETRATGTVASAGNRTSAITCPTY